MPCLNLFWTCLKPIVIFENDVGEKAQSDPLIAEDKQILSVEKSWSQVGYGSPAL